MMEGSGSVHLTSGSGRPKNLRIRLQIGNTELISHDDDCTCVGHTFYFFKVRLHHFSEIKSRKVKTLASSWLIGLSNVYQRVEMLYRVPECLSIIWNGSPLSPQASVAFPSLGPNRGQPHSVAGKRVGGPNSDDRTDTMVIFIVII